MGREEDRERERDERRRAAGERVSEEDQLGNEVGCIVREG